MKLAMLSKQELDDYQIEGGNTKIWRHLDVAAKKRDQC